MLIKKNNKNIIKKIIIFIMGSKSFLVLFYLLLISSISYIFGKPFAKSKEKKTDYAKTNEPFPRKLQDEHDSFITLNFSKDCTYSTGFQNSHRSDINFTIKGENDIIIESNESLFISKDSGIEIHFKGNVTNLNNFFSCSEDSNMESLKSIDFSHFDSSFISEFSEVFKGCTSLENINLTKFDA